MSTSRDMLKSNAVAITFAIGENDFKGVVDLVETKLLFVRNGRLMKLLIFLKICLMKLKNRDRFLLKQ
jgi:hypothetical protein